jgi:hypothetical protein
VHSVRILFAVLILCSFTSLYANQEDASVKENQRSVIREKYQNTNSTRLGDIIREIQQVLYDRTSQASTLLEHARVQQETAPLLSEQGQIISLLKERSDGGDIEAGFHYSRFIAFRCAGFVKRKTGNLAEAYCSIAKKELEAQSERGDPRTMEILAQWYESGIYFEKSNYIAAEWYAKIMKLAIKNGFKGLAAKNLEIVDRLYPKYPDLEVLRRTIVSMN